MNRLKTKKVVCYMATRCTFIPKLEKYFKSPPPRKFFIFLEIKLSRSNIKKILTLLEMKLFVPNIKKFQEKKKSKTETLKSFFYFRKLIFLAQILINFLYFLK